MDSFPGMFVHFITYETLIKVVSVAYYALETVALWAIRRLTRFGFGKLSRRYAGTSLSTPSGPVEPNLFEWPSFLFMLWRAGG